MKGKTQRRQCFHINCYTSIGASERLGFNVVPSFGSLLVIFIIFF